VNDIPEQSEHCKLIIENKALMEKFMKKAKEKKVEPLVFSPVAWQLAGGSLEIPDGWFVQKADFDCDEPYIEIAEDSSDREKRIQVPKSLAYYLSTHSCGSRRMRSTIEKQCSRT
jgi:hypothetical protein